MSDGNPTLLIVRQIIDAVAGGSSLARACDAAGLHVTEFYRHISSVRELSIDYARAREIRADLDADEAVEIADNPDIDASRARNMIDIRKWRASKHNSKVYGDRVDLNVAQTISINDALAEAATRLVLPRRYQHDALDAEVIDLPTLPAPSATDTQSEAARPGDDLGIFD